MKNSLIFICILFLSFSSSAQEDDPASIFYYLNFPFTNPLKGEVQYVESHIYKYERFRFKKEIEKRKTTYNTEKEITEDICWSGNQIIDHLVREFSDGKLFREVFCSLQRVRETVDQNKLPQFLPTQTEVPEYKLKCSYISIRTNKFGKPILKKYYSKDSILEQTTTYTYNAVRKLAAEYHFNGKDTLHPINWLNYTYDDNDSLSEIREVRFVKPASDDRLGYMIKFNSKGQIIKFLQYDQNNKFSSHELRTYNEKGDLLEIKEKDEKGNTKIKSQYSYRYDAKGQISESEEKDSEGKIVNKKTYTFDATGNFIKIEIESDGIKYMIKRKIVYHPFICSTCLK